MKAFDNIAINDNKYQIHIEKYYLPLPQERDKCERVEDARCTSNVDDVLSYQECQLPIIAPHIAMWDYLPKADVNTLLAIERRIDIRKFILEKLDKKPKGIPRIVVRELMYTVTKFCKCQQFTPEQAGAVLSQFYLTHLYFTSCYYLGAEKLYNYFKEFQLCHSLPFPPRNIKLFTLQQTKNIMTYFCRLYLRNLPLIRVMCLPNFFLRVGYHVEPDLNLSKKKKGGKGKKDKGKSKKKKK